MRLGGVSREPAGPGERAGLICSIVDLAERPILPFHIKRLEGGGYLDIASRGTPPTTCCANFWHSRRSRLRRCVPMLMPRPSPQNDAITLTIRSVAAPPRAATPNSEPRR